MKTHAGRAAKCIPLPNETIKEWLQRYEALFNKKPDSRFMQNTEWPSISVATGVHKNASQALQSAITVLRELDPEGDSYYWPGQLRIWFTSEADAVMLKLRMTF